MGFCCACSNCWNRFFTCNIAIHNNAMVLNGLQKISELNLRIQVIRFEFMRGILLFVQYIVSRWRRVMLEEV